MIQFDKILEDNYEKWKDKGFVYEKVNGKYEGRSYGDFIDNAYNIANYLISKGYFEKPIMIYGNNSTNLMMADLAIFNYVGTSVWVSKELMCEGLLRVVKQLGIECVIYGEEKYEIMKELVSKVPDLVCISSKEIGNIPHSEKKCIPTEPEKCCKIVYSSGTTSNPKAVMLSKKNIFAGIDSLYRRCKFNENDVDYLFLPLSHTYGSIYNFIYGLVFGYSIYLCSDVSNIGQEILEVNPSIFCGVPVIYRKFYENYGEKIGIGFGNRIKYLFCGGAHFDEDIRRAYKESGLNMMEAYGLSETASTFSIQYPEDMNVKSVGRIAEDIEVKIINPDENGIGEIVVKGENVFLGYAGNPELTASVFTEDGYFKTGDLGYIIENDLYITGRIKKVLVGENGENIEPGPIEKLIGAADTNINKALLYIQEGKLACRLYINQQKNRNWDEFFADINSKLTKPEKIKSFEIVIDSVEKRLKQ